MIVTAFHALWPEGFDIHQTAGAFAGVSYDFPFFLFFIIIPLKLSVSGLLRLIGD
jgi:hypothetical protein